MLDGLWPDIRSNLRSLARSPGFTAFVVLTLALGIGANTAIFSVADAFIFKPVPFPDADRLVMLHQKAPGNSTFPASVSPADYLDFQNEATSYQKISAFERVDFNLSGNGDPEPVFSAVVTPNFFDTLGVKPELGRTFAADEDIAGKNQVVVLSHGLWERRFGADPRIVGRDIKLNGGTYSVIGVMGKQVRFPVACLLWTPLTLSQAEKSDRANHYVQVVARLKDGVPESQARAELQTIATHLAEKYPRTNQGWGVIVQPLRRFITGDFNREYSLLLLAAVFFVLLIACANVMNLQFARMSGRHKEFAIRTALGAARGRLIRQIVAESMMLSIAGALASLFFSAWSLDLILSNMPGNVARYIPGWDTISIDGRALAFTITIALFAGLISGLIPALGTRADVNDTLKESGRGTSAGRGRQRLRSILVVAEIAATMVLLAGAGLMVKGARTLLHVHENLKPQSLLTMQIVLTDKHYGEAHQRAGFYDRVLEKIGALPGVQSATLASNIPYGYNDRMSTYTVEGQPVVNQSQQKTALVQTVSPNYLDTIGVPLLQGRGLRDSDGPEAQPVALVTENFVRRNFPDKNPIGQHVRLRGEGAWMTVVGVVKDVRYDPLATEMPAAIYQPYRQSPLYYTYIAVRAKGDPIALAGPIRRAVAAIDIDRPLFEIDTLDRTISNRMIGLSYVAVLLTVLGAIAMVFSAVGIYGLMAFAVTERTHEIGIRVALGADRPDVLRMVAWRGLLLTAGGLAIGLAISIPLARLLSSLIFGVSANDLTTFGGTAVLLTVVALAACYLPARRALAVDPIIALRHQ
ncbi:MAG TPA: ABC transporter permease [Bryobacteraceae bacterium]|nr:ABC transporter permease [Bryobacteraceae bacterium]